MPALETIYIGIPVPKDLRQVPIEVKRQLMRCLCGREVELIGNTNRCQCGRRYDRFGKVIIIGMS